MRFESRLLSPSFAATHPSFPNTITYTYVYRAPDRALVLIDAGWGLWVDAIVAGVPRLVDNADARDRLEAALDALAPGSELDDVAAIYFEHGHPDHTGQARMVRDARASALELWAGEGDRAMLETITGLESCTGELPDGAAAYLPLFAAPEFDVHYVPSGAAADGGHGITLIPAPSHTPGSLIVYLRDLDLTITGNHLSPADAGTTGDCGTPDEASGCPAPCDVYQRSLGLFPPGAHVLHVHPLTL